MKVTAIPAASASARPKDLPAVIRALPTTPVPRRWSPRPPLALVVALLVAASLLLGGCSSDEPVARGPTAKVADGGRTLLLDDGRQVRELAQLPQEDGVLVHAAVRPGAHDPLTVLALARVEEPPPVTGAAEDDAGREAPAARYELRYLVVEDEASELFWFPWRLQVDATVAQVLDVPPVPVWAPDGSAIAWVEWSATDGTKLRTVGWIDDGFSQNPSDDAAVYQLAEVPAGVQLDHWETDPEGNAVMVGAGDGANWRITVDLDTGTLAAGVGPDGLLSPDR
jgi:hypothetical protein